MSVCHRQVSTECLVVACWWDSDLAMQQVSLLLVRLATVAASDDSAQHLNLRIQIVVAKSMILGVVLARQQRSYLRWKICLLQELRLVVLREVERFAVSLPRVALWCHRDWGWTLFVPLLSRMLRV